MSKRGSYADFAGASQTVAHWSKMPCRPWLYNISVATGKTTHTVRIQCFAYCESTICVSYSVVETQIEADVELYMDEAK